MSQVDAALAAVADIAKLEHANLDFEVRRLRAWRELAIKNLPLEEGGRAAISHSFPDIPQSSGWYTYRECLRPEQTGVIGEIDINPDTLVISALFKPDTAWVVVDYGNVTERFPNETCAFYIQVKYLRPVVEGQEPIPMPEDGEPR